MHKTTTQHEKLHAFLELQADTSLVFINDANKAVDSAELRKEYQKKHQTLTFPDFVWTAFWLNVSEMRTVLRKTGRPYATHPLTVALAGYELLGHGKQQDQTAAMCLLHDYLEEGPGFSKEAFDALKIDMKACLPGAMAAVLLSEPFIDYSLFKIPKRMMEYVAYVQQILLIKDRIDPTYFNTSILDKIHNVHCWDYIVLDADKYGDENKRDKKIGLKLAQYRFVNDQLRPYSDKRLSSLLDDSIIYFSKHFGFETDEVFEGSQRLESLRAENEEKLTKLIREYHVKLAVWSK